MLEWIAGTLAWTYVKNKAIEEGASQAKGFAVGQGGKIFRSLADQFKESVPADNEQLLSAFHRSCLIATQQICNRLNNNLGNDNLPSLSSKLRKSILGDVPASMSGQYEKEWLEKAKAHLQNKVNEFESHQTYLPKQSSDKYRTLILSNEISDDEAAEEFQDLLTKNAIDELGQALSEEPPKSFIEEMLRNWIDLVGNDFLNSISGNPTLANMFQNKTLAKIALDNTIVEIKIDDILKLLPELIRQDGDKTRIKIGESTAEILKAFSSLESQPKRPPQIVFNLPNLTEISRQAEVL